MNLANKIGSFAGRLFGSFVVVAAKAFGMATGIGVAVWLFGGDGDGKPMLPITEASVGEIAVWVGLAVFMGYAMARILFDNA